MFYYYFNEILKFGFPMKYLPLSVHNIFLQIECNIFSYAEILHCIRDDNSHLIAYPEEMIYSCFAGKDYSSKVKNIDFLLAKIFHRDTLNLIKWLKINFQVVFPCQLEIWRFRILRLRLRH